MIRRRVARRLLPVALLATAVAGWLAYDRGQVGSEATSSPAPADADGPHLALSAPEASSPMLRSPLGCEGVGDADSGSKARGASTPATSALAAAHEGHRLLTSAVSGRDERLARLASVSKTELASAVEHSQVKGDIDTESTAFAFLGLIQTTCFIWSLSEFNFPISQRAAALWRAFSESLS